ncbi:MAG: chromate transporter [Paludibacteraceae bacterium]|nr:chromate transporter [Paludibacteraceae bacterium]
MWSIYLKLFYSFFKIGLFGFGGGYAILSLIEYDMVELYKWISIDKFTDIVAISQSTPGAISINCATYVGYEVGGILGSIIATISVCLPSFILIISFYQIAKRFKNNKISKNIIKFLRPVIVGLIASAVISLTGEETFGEPSSYVIFLITLTCLCFKKTNQPIILLFIAALFGICFY